MNKQTYIVKNNIFYIFVKRKQSPQLGIFGRCIKYATGGGIILGITFFSGSIRTFGIRNVSDQAAHQLRHELCEVSKNVNTNSTGRRFDHKILTCNSPQLAAGSLYVLSSERERAN